MDDFRVKKAAEILSRFFDETTLQAVSQFETFRSSWKHIVGQRLADHSRPKSVVRRTLLIAADHAGWIQLLQMDQERILARIAKHYPELEIMSLAFTVEELRGAEELSSKGQASPRPAAPDHGAAGQSSAATEPGACPETLSSGHGQKRRPLPEPLREIFSRMRGGDSGQEKGN